MKIISTLVSLAFFSNFAVAAMHKDEIVYKQGDTELKGYVFWDDAFGDSRPGVMVVHEKWGMNDYATLRAEMLAESGHVAFAVDMFGDARLTRKEEEATAWTNAVTSDTGIWRERVKLALEQLKSHPKVDPNKIAAVGYSFGGSTVMQLAYSGADLNGVVSVHGLLPAATVEEARKIKSKVLILHGDADPYTNKDTVNQFTDVLSKAKVNWEMDIYGGARHSFSNPYADGYGITGEEYNIEADQRSWGRILTFLESLFED